MNARHFAAASVSSPSVLVRLLLSWSAVLQRPVQPCEVLPQTDCHLSAEEGRGHGGPVLSGLNLASSRTGLGEGLKQVAWPLCLSFFICGLEQSLSHRTVARNERGRYKANIQC